MKKNRKGFTLAELLIVVAIIAVLVAIAIPVFTTQLERSREATDLSNIRSAYAEAMTEYIANGATGTYSASASTIQKDASWHIERNLTIRVDGEESNYALPHTVKTTAGAYAVVTVSNTNTSTAVDVSFKG